MSQNPENPNSETKDQAIERLQGIAGRNQLIIDNLEKNVGWEGVIEDFTKERQRLDDTWQYVTDEKRWQEFRVTKLAVMKILNLLNDYKQDKSTALREIYEWEHPEKVTMKDYDSGK